MNPEEVAEEVGVVEVVEPAHEAYLLRLGGLTWPEVARRTGYSSRQTARMAVKAYLERVQMEQAADQRAEALQLAVDRYEAVLAANWQKMQDGNVDAAMIVLRTQTRLDHLYRLEEKDAAPGARTIVIAGSPEEYVAGLKAVWEERQQRRALLPGS